jgi:3-hydroxybutyryl-CoA dehydrogenase
MKILVIGEDRRYEELRQVLNNPAFIIERGMSADEEELMGYDFIFDLNFDDDQENLAFYAGLKNKIVFVSSVKTTMAEAAYLYGERIHCCLVGMNALPGFIHRSRWELAIFHRPMSAILDAGMKHLNQEYDLVEDRVGMLTPRILCMIINEACYTLQEGTADVAAIDTAMKLGTNYPFGPFEWADKIGITDVFETLNALYEDTHEERYKICPLLKTKYLKNQRFYPKA